jgi:predicted nucleic acid-binding protein
MSSPGAAGLRADRAGDARTRAQRARRGSDPPGLTEGAWRLADELGWAKTYDAHYVALAQMLCCKLVTLDERLHRGLGRFGISVGPSEL